MKTDTEIFNLNDDTPIVNATHDIFERSKIVDAIVKTINLKAKTNHSCFAIGIYAKWGEGKTSVLNLIEEKLRSQKDNIVISKFNPWFFKDQESLLFDFFNSIDGENVSEVFLNNLRKYGPIVSMGISGVINMFAPGVGSILNKSVTKFIDKIPEIKISPVERKRELSKNIVDSKKHLVILIDDVDRLDKEETHALFKLIKQTADFDNTIFIIAMDKDVVAKSLCSKFESGDIMSGYNFIEKIIQMQLYLPKIHQGQMLEYLNSKFDSLTDSLKEHSELIDETEFVQAKKDINKYVLPLITTAREVIQYINILSYSVPMIYDEVNISDLCLLEALKIIHPQGYNVILNNKHIVLKDFNDTIHSVNRLIDQEMANDEVKKEKEEFLKSILSECPENKTYYIQLLIKKILDCYFDGNPVFSNSASKKRLCSIIYYDKYFIFDVPESIMSDKQVRELTALIKDSDYLGLKENFEDQITKYDNDEFFRVLYHIIHQDYNQLNSDIIANICIALSLLNQNNDRTLFFEINYGKRLELKIVDILVGYFDNLQKQNRIVKFDSKYCVAKTIVEKSNELFGIFFIVEFNGRSVVISEKNQDEDDITLSSIKRFISRYSERELFRLDQRYLKNLFGTWKKLKPEEYNDFILRHIPDNEFDVVDLINRFIFNSDKKYYAPFIELFDKEIVYGRLKSEINIKPNLMSEEKNINLFMSLYEKEKSKLVIDA